MEFSRQEYWSGLPFPPPGALPIPGIKPRSVLQADSLSAEPPGKPVYSDSLQHLHHHTQERKHAWAWLRQAVHHVKMGSLYTLILCVDVSQITQEVPDLRVVSITLSKMDTHTIDDYYVSWIPVQWYLKIPGLVPAVVFSSTSISKTSSAFHELKVCKLGGFYFFYIFLVCLNQWYSMECDLPRNPWGIWQCLETFLTVMTNGMQLASSRRRPGYC